MGSLLALAVGMSLVMGECQPDRPGGEAGCSHIEVIPGCEEQACVPAGRLVHEYSTKVRERPEVYILAGNGNGWRMYDVEGMVLTAVDIADMVRADPVFASKGEVRLMVSWAGEAPKGAKESLAQAVSRELGRPASGPKGFLWFGPDGALRETRQEFTAYEFPYRAKAGDWVMASTSIAMPGELVRELSTGDDVEGLRLAARSEDVFALRFDEAVKLYERAASLGDGISAYNAAVIRLQRSGPGDRLAAEVLLNRAEALGVAEVVRARKQFRL
jgi:hypothetical protein